MQATVAEADKIAAEQAAAAAQLQQQEGAAMPNGS